MKTVLITIIAAVLACGLLLAQETPPAPGTGSVHQPIPPAGQQAPPASTEQPGTTAPASGTAASGTSTTKIAPGSVIPVQLTKTVDAKKAKTGDEVDAKVTQDLQATSGKVIVPKDTKVVGHVTEAQKRSKEQKESQLAIAFDRMDIKGGEQVQLPMSIQAIIAPPNRNAANENNPGASNQQQPGSPTGGNPAPSAGAGARGGMAGSSGSAPSPPNAPGNTGSMPSGQQNSAGAMPQITGETRGVVGISDMTLSAATNPTQGSLVTSDKNNVKLEDGTFLLLRVNPQGGVNPAAQPSQPQSPQ